MLGLAMLGVGTVSHVAADGLLPSWPALVGLLVVCTAISAPLVRGPVGPLRVVTMLVGGQALTHLVLSASAGHTGEAAYPARAVSATPLGSALDPAVVDGRRVGSLMDQSVAPALEAARATGPGPLDHLLSHALAAGPWMLLAHTAAAVALGLWLALGEAALWGLLTAAAVACREVLALRPTGAARPPVPSARVVLRSFLVPVRPADPVHLRVPSRRGPPLFLGT